VKPDLAFVDLGLPGLDGYRLARRVRAGNRHVCLVALTGYGQDADVRGALEAGFDEHLTKPADPERLDEVLTGRSAGLQHKLDQSAANQGGESGEWSRT
jgi:CheY-like chemotaxis protein